LSFHLLLGDALWSFICDEMIQDVQLTLSIVDLSMYFVRLLWDFFIKFVFQDFEILNR
jgi:hypothetical protein